MDDPCDDWNGSFSYRIGKMMRHAIGIDYNPQFDLCDDCSHWIAGPWPNVPGSPAIIGSVNNDRQD